MRAALAPLLATVLLAGCRGSELMPAPTAIAAGHVDPFEEVAPARRDPIAVVFAASSRTPSGHPEPARFYSKDRSREVRLGKAGVLIGPGMSWSELVAESKASPRRTNPHLEFVEYHEYGALWNSVWPPDFRIDRDWDRAGVDRGPTEEFEAALREVLAQSRTRTVTVFVHGFNTTFARNIELVAELWHFLGREGAMISFDWPSKGNPFSYQEDKSNAALAVRQLRKLLEFLAEVPEVERIDILGHSAGCPVVSEALRQLSLMHWDVPDEEARRRTRIRRVALAAPDMDLDEAVGVGLDGAGRVAEGLAIYASTRDRALKFASGIFGDVRLGRSIGKLAPDERDALVAHDRDWIDVTEAQRRHSSFIGHSYFHENPWVSSDLLLWFATGASPEQRGLVRDLETGFAVFPHDYESRLPEVVERLGLAPDA